jgi:hypothetical protein
VPWETVKGHAIAPVLLSAQSCREAGVGRPVALGEPIGATQKGCPREPSITADLSTTGELCLTPVPGACRGWAR